MTRSDAPSAPSAIIRPDILAALLAAVTAVPAPDGQARADARPADAFLQLLWHAPVEVDEDEKGPRVFGAAGGLVVVRHDEQVLLFDARTGAVTARLTLGPAPAVLAAGWLVAHESEALVGYQVTPGGFLRRWTIAASSEAMLPYGTELVAAATGGTVVLTGVTCGSRCRNQRNVGHFSEMIAVDVATGLVRWRRPAVLETLDAVAAAGDRIVVVSRGEAAAHDAASGRQLWRAGGRHDGDDPSVLAAVGKDVFFAPAGTHSAPGGRHGARVAGGPARRHGGPELDSHTKHAVRRSARRLTLDAAAPRARPRARRRYRPLALEPSLRRAGLGPRRRADPDCGGDGAGLGDAAAAGRARERQDPRCVSSRPRHRRGGRTHRHDGGRDSRRQQRRRDLARLACGGRPGHAPVDLRTSTGTGARLTDGALAGFPVNYEARAPGWPVRTVTTDARGELSIAIDAPDVVPLWLDGKAIERHSSATGGGRLRWSCVAMPRFHFVLGPTPGRVDSDRLASTRTNERRKGCSSGDRRWNLVSLLIARRGLDREIVPKAPLLRRPPLGNTDTRRRLWWKPGSCDPVALAK